VIKEGALYGKNLILIGSNKSSDDCCWGCNEIFLVDSLSIIDFYSKWTDDLILMITRLSRNRRATAVGIGGRLF